MGNEYSIDSDDDTKEESFFVCESRKCKIPNDIYSYRDTIKKAWNENKKIFPSKSNVSNIGLNDLQKAGEAIKSYFDENNIESLNVLELMAGNCVASKCVQKYINYVKWISTDIDKSDCVDCLEKDAIDAIEEFGNQSDLLIMISPPPSPSIKDDSPSLGYGDFFACDYFIKNSNRIKYIIIIGELGASDGTGGMYDFLMNNEKLDCVIRKVIKRSVVQIIDDVCTKEVFIFKMNP